MLCQSAFTAMSNRGGPNAWSRWAGSYMTQRNEKQCHTLRLGPHMPIKSVFLALFLRSHVRRWVKKDIYFAFWQWCAEIKMKRMTIMFVWKTTPSCRPVHLTLLLEPFRPANLAQMKGCPKKQQRKTSAWGVICGRMCRCRSFLGETTLAAWQIASCEVKHSMRSWSNVAICRKNEEITGYLSGTNAVFDMWLYNRTVGHMYR